MAATSHRTHASIRGVGFALARAACAALLLATCSEPAKLERVGPPNVVLIVADDFGWADFAGHGGPARTPNLDRLAREGVELERFYTWPVCSATRAQVLTGRYPPAATAADVEAMVVLPGSETGLDPATPTLAERLGRAGFDRRGAFGKWHLGHARPEQRPLARGFSAFRGHLTGAVDYFAHTRDGELDWYDGEAPLVEEGYATDLIAAAAARFIEAGADRGPFFCYVAFNAPHAPYQAPPELVARYAHLAQGDPQSVRPVAAAMVEALDRGVGRVLDALESAGVERRTLVWFASDNGGSPDVPGSNAPLRGDKFDVFEGGVRVPSFARLPGVFPPGTKVSAPIAAIDVVPTVLEACGVAGGPSGGPFDGASQLGVLARRAPSRPRDLYFLFAWPGQAEERLALLRWPHKLIVHGTDVANPAACSATMLFDLERDPLETQDLASEQSELVEELRGRLTSFRRAEGMDPGR